MREYGLCLFHPDYKNESIFQVKGSYEEGIIKSLRIDGLPCTLDDPIQCVTGSELKDLTVQFINPLANVNYSNFKEPVRYKFKHLLDIQPESKFSQLFSAKLSIESVFDFSGFLSNEKILNKFIQPIRPNSFAPTFKPKAIEMLYCTWKMILETAECQPHFSMVLQSSQEESLQSETTKAQLRLLEKLEAINRSLMQSLWCFMPS